MSAPATYPTVLCGLSDGPCDDALAAVAEQLATALGARTAIADDGSARRLIDRAGDPDIGLLVVGAPGSEDPLLASDAARLAAEAPCPVVLIPTDSPALIAATSWEGGCFVVGYDGSANAQRGAATAAALAGRLGARLSLVRVIDGAGESAPSPLPTTESLRAVASAAGGGPLDVSGVTRHGDPADQLERVAAASTASAIVVGCRGRLPWRAPLLGSVSRQVMARARRPVVVLPPFARLRHPLSQAA